MKTTQLPALTWNLVTKNFRAHDCNLNLSKGERFNEWLKMIEQAIPPQTSPPAPRL
jgi:hypothetical protein